MKKAISSLVVAAVATGVAASASNAAISIDLRPTSGDRTIAVNAPGFSALQLDVWAVVTGADADDNEGFQSAWGSVRSTNLNGGAALGNLSFSLAAPFNGTSAQAGASADLDGDGDLDVGSNSAAAGYIFPRANSMVTGAALAGAESNLIAGGREFKIGTGSFTLGSLSSFSSTATTQLEWQGRIDTPLFVAGGWLQDGNSATTPTGSSVPTGTGTTLYQGFAAANAGSDLTVEEGSGLNLSGLGTASTFSSVASYEWDVNGDGTFDFTGADLSLTGEQLSTLGMTVGNSYLAALRVTSADGFTAFDTTEISVTAVPEPAGIAAIGLAATAFLRRRRRTA